jgi:hypothetical protein
MLSDSMNVAILKNQIEFIAEHIDRFVPMEKEK